MKTFLRSLAVLAVLALASSAIAQQATQQSGQVLTAATLTATATGAGNTAVTASVGAVIGQCLYITDVYIAEAANATVVVGAGPAPIFTTTGLPTNIVWWGDNSALAQGVEKIVTDKHYVNPLKLPQSTAFTIVTSAGQSTQNVRINVLAYAAAC